MKNIVERKAVLFFTNSDFGQVNVVLAVANELLRENKLDIHIASWPILESRLESLSQRVQNENPSQSIPPIKFHSFASFSGCEAYLKRREASKADVPHPPGRHGAQRFAQLTAKYLAAWKPEQHLSFFDWSAGLTRHLDPALLVLDPFLIPIHDMARTLMRKYAVLSPCTLAEGLIPEQPWLAALWKYPAFSTGFPYPVPWSKIPENIYCNWAARKRIWHPEVQVLNQARRAHGIHDTLGNFTPWVKDVPHICPSLPSIDLPMKIPPNVYNCGPILLSTPPIDSSDLDLFTWLKQRPTVLMVLGTHFEAYAETLREQAIGLHMLLEARPDIQVLWKLKAEKVTENSGRESVNNILGQELKSGRVKIESWLKADPVAIMTSGHVVCAVHHGGANSYFEAAWAGIPQVVLAMWYDTFEYATRVEYLGIGVYGNRVIGHNAVVDINNYVAPLMVDGVEFGEALFKAVGKVKGAAEAMQNRAAELGEVCRKSGGRVEAAKIITDLCFED